MDRRDVTIDRSPPKRLLADNRWRTFKTGPDAQVWDLCMAPVQKLVDDGWRVDAVHVIWGRSYPGNVPERVLRRLLGVEWDVMVSTDWKPEIPRGESIFTLVK